MMNNADVVVVLCTFPTGEKVVETARLLVEKGLVACVGIVPAVRSIYTWHGQICDETESLLIIKTRKILLNELEREIKLHHPYEVPEIIALDIASLHKPYLE